MNYTEQMIDAILKDDKDELKDVNAEKLNELSDRIWMIGIERQIGEGE